MNAEEPLLVTDLSYNFYDAVNEEPDYQVTVKSEVKYLVKSLIPLLITFVLQYSVMVTAVFACGKLGPREIAAASLAICTYSITGVAIIQGFATSLDSYCSQAYSSGNITGVGTYFQRCSLLMFAVISPISIIWWNSGPILNLMVPDRELTKLTQTFLRVNILSVPGTILFESGKRFLQAQHIYNPGTYFLFIATPINFILHWLLVWHPVYGVGFIGSPIAMAVTNTLLPILMLLYVIFVDGKKCWGGFNFKKARSGWKPMLQLSIPGVIMIEAEYLAFEVITILAASFGTNSLAAQSITANISSLAFQIPFSVAVAVSTRIGYWLGKDDLNSARLVVKISWAMAVVVGFFLWVTIFFNRETIASTFTTDKKVIAIAIKVLGIASCNQLIDVFNVVGAGILRGQGRQKIGSVVNLISYYMVGLPLCYVLGFHTSVGFLGLWYGLVSGVSFLAVIQSLSIFYGNWDKILISSKLRRARDGSISSIHLEE